jgi:hypothetical protein
MAQLILSAAQTLNIANSVKAVASSPTSGTFSISNSTNNAWLRIMKGTVPTDFSTLTAYTSRSTDVLVNVAIQTGAVTGVSPNIFMVDTGGVYTNATGTGTATWFWLCAGNTNNAGIQQSVNWTLMQQLIGTVSGVGGGGDIELAVTAIVTGAPFKVSAFDITMDFASTY